MDKPYDISGSQESERSDPPSFAEHEENDVSGGGPSTMDGSRSEFVLHGTETGRFPLEHSNTREIERSPAPRLLPRPLDNTALEAYMSCPRKYYYSMVLNRRGRGSLSPALAYGTVWHAIMESHYKSGGHNKTVVEAAIKAWKPHENPEDHRTLERAITEYANYCDRWGDHEAEMVSFGRTVGWPDSPIVECPAEVWWPGALHPYTGKIDRIFEHQGLYYVEDHKTTSAMGASYFKQFDPSNQMMGYAWLAQKLSGLPIAGVRINAHAVLKGSSKFERQTIGFSPERLEEWAENLNTWVIRLHSSYSSSPSDIGEFGLARAWPHNFQACAGKYGQCVYTDVCTMPARLRTRVLEADYAEQPWNPLDPGGDSE